MLPRGVAAGHPATVAAGIELLEDGGTAADAAVAASLASCVAETVMTGLLGGGHAIHWDGREAVNLDCFVDVPSGAGAPPLALKVPFGEELVHYAVGLVHATRQSADVRLGASPRGSLGLLRASQSLAAAEGRTFAVADDVKRLAVPVLAHRLLIAPEAQLRGITAERVIGELLTTVAVPGGVGR